MNLFYATAPNSINWKRKCTRAHGIEPGTAHSFNSEYCNQLKMYNLVADHFTTIQLYYTIRDIPINIFFGRMHIWSVYYTFSFYNYKH